MPLPQPPFLYRLLQDGGRANRQLLFRSGRSRARLPFGFHPYLMLNRHYTNYLGSRVKSPILGISRLNRLGQKLCY